MIRPPAPSPDRTHAACGGTLLADDLCERCGAVVFAHSRQVWYLGRPTWARPEDGVLDVLGVEHVRDVMTERSEREHVEEMALDALDHVRVQAVALVSVSFKTHSIPGLHGWAVRCRYVVNLDELRAVRGLVELLELRDAEDLEEREREADFDRAYGAAS